MKRLFGGAMRGLALAAGLALPAQAQTFPERPVTMIVPFAAGGPTDTLARILAQAMAGALAQSVVIENVPGNAGAIGAQRLIRAKPDGYTILISDLALPAAPLLNAAVTYDLARDFTPLGLVNAGPMVLLARSGFAPAPEAAFGQMKAKAKALNLGHSGLGSNSHMCGLLVQQALGATFTEVPYRGAGPAMNDLLAGTLDLMCEQSTTAIPQIEGGKVSAVGVTSPARLPVLPDVPTLAAGGLSGFDFTLWHGLYAPPGTPAAIVGRLNAALRAALADPAVRERYAQAGRTEFPEGELTPDAHRARLLRSRPACAPRWTRPA